MRTLLLGDIIAAARALLVLPPDQRIGLSDVMIQQADAAHRFFKRRAMPHPKWGNGSLMARANLEPQVAEPFASDADYLLAIQTVIDGILSRRTGILPR